MPSSREERVERLYAEAERKNEVRKAATVRRGPIGLIAVCIGVALVVGAVAVVDLRRLQTPRGTALAWTGAAVFGDCAAFRRLSAGSREVPEEDADERCLALRRETEPARDRPADVQIEVVEVREQAGSATALVRVRRPRTVRREVELSLRPRDGGWVVVLDDATCEALPCL